MIDASAPAQLDDAFPLLWAVAMSGHRRLEDEDRVRTAVSTELDALKNAVEQMGSKLLAISSIARGADLIFAEECLKKGLPWKCLLPFARDEFRRTGEFTEDEWQRVEWCLARAYHVRELNAGVPESEEARNAAYRDCGHRMIEDADVIMLVWDGVDMQRAGGTSEMAEYAGTLSKPTWQWNPKTGAGAHLPGWPGENGEWRQRKLFHSRVSPLLREAARTEPTPEDPAEAEACSPCHGSLRLLFRRLDALALGQQVSTQKCMQNVLLAHLGATVAAALAVTVLAEESRKIMGELPLVALLLALVFSLLLLAKPVLASLALWWDQRLHHLQSHELWVEARVAAELCRSALTCWRFPGVPLTVFTDEDFPHFKRLLRSLRMARESEALPCPSPGEDAVYRDYSARRIQHQIDYFEQKHRQATQETRYWQRHFNGATWFVIIAGSILGILEAGAACLGLEMEGEFFAPDAVPTSGQYHMACAIISFLLIVAPFYASYALAMLSIRDCRRRGERFKAMTEFLQRQQRRLGRIKSPSSRTAAVENTERMLLEELHEWYSVMRAVRV